jgi:hypothetical protein
LSKISREPESYFRDGDVVPFIGVVENTADPMQIGRVQVRCISFHPERSDGQVPTDDLPWAFVLLPTTASGVSGVGSTHGLVDGSWVMGMFLDGRDAQQPVVFGAFVGAPGLTPLQREYVASGLSISGGGPGGLASMFQTAMASVVGGLGNATKFGATVGGLMSLVDMFKNDDFFKTLSQVAGVGPTGQERPKIADVVDSAAVAALSDAVSSAGAKLPGVGALASVAGSLAGVFSAGGAKGFSAGAASPLSAASVGTFAAPGEEATADKATVEVKTDYHALAAAAPGDVGSLSVYSTGTPKNKRYSLDALQLDYSQSGQSDGRGAPYHFIIDQTGTIIKSRDQGVSGGAGQNANAPSVADVPMKGLQVALVGGADEGPINARYYPAQMASLEKLVDAYVKRFPNMSISSGSDSDSSARGPGFDVVEWAATKWPKNAGKMQDRVPQDQAVEVSSKTYTQRVKEITDRVPQAGGVDGDSGTTPTGMRRGFQGGPSHPNPGYAAKKQSDVPAMARVNALSAVGGGVQSDRAAGGGPAQQYLAKMEEPSTRTFPKARMADTLEARSIPETWNPPVRPHGGEYGSAHVVRSTEGGHHVLLDDTSGRQKVEIMHSSGSMLQIHADGSGMFYVKNDSHEVVIGDKYLGIQGGLHVSVGGDCKFSVKGDLGFDVTGKISLNGASSMHELIRGDRSTVTEGSHLFQAKKNATHRVGKDLSQQVGGKMDTAVRGTRHDSTDGNSTTTTRGESSEFVGGNKSSLVVGSKSDHAQNIAQQATGDALVIAAGSAVVQGRGKATITSDGDVNVSGGADVNVVSGAEAAVTAGGRVNVNAGGAVDVDGSTINLNSGNSSAKEAVPTADVETPPAQLTRESNPASSDGNINAEQTTLGEIDAAEASDNSGESGGAGPGGLNSGGAASGSDPVFTPATSGGEVSATPSLGNVRDNACAIANDLVARGWSQEGASGLVGHMINESGLNPAAYNPNDVGKAAAGMAQWRDDRLRNLQAFAASRNENWQSRATQVAFIDHEARTGESGAGSMMIGASTIEQGILGGAAYERFRGYKQAFTGGEWTNSRGQNRAGNGLAVYNECFGKNVPSVGGQGATPIEQFTGGSGGGGSSGGGGGGGGGGGDGSDASTVEQGTGEGGDNSAERGPYAQGGPVDWSRKVSPNYTLGDLTPTSKFHAGPNKTPRGTISSDQLITNLSACAVNVLEPMLAAIGKPWVMSGYRSFAYNRKIGGAGNSDHTYGRAVDIKVPGRSPAFVANWVERNLPNVAGIGRYPSFTHVSYYIGGNNGRKRRWGRN